MSAKHTRDMRRDNIAGTAAALSSFHPLTSWHSKAPLVWTRTPHPLCSPPFFWLPLDLRLASGLEQCLSSSNACGKPAAAAAAVQLALIRHTTLKPRGGQITAHSRCHAVNTVCSAFDAEDGGFFETRTHKK